MTKETVIFTNKKNDKEFQFICDKEASLGEAFDVLTEFRTHILQTMANLDKLQETKNGQENVDSGSSEQTSGEVAQSS